MTPAEYVRRARAYIDSRKEIEELERVRQENERRRTAWIVATIINMSGKVRKGSDMTIEQLLGNTTAPVIENMDVSRRRIDKRFKLSERGFTI